MADQTVRVFDEFYNLDITVNADTYIVVESFFSQYTNSPVVARSFAQNLFRIAQVTNQDVLTLLKDFEGLDSMNINLTMAYYLNSLGDRTFMYGISVIPTPVLSVARNVVQ